MAEWLELLAYALRSCFKSRARLEAENLVLRQQLDGEIRDLIRPGVHTLRKLREMNRDGSGIKWDRGPVRTMPDEDEPQTTLCRAVCATS